MQAKKCSRIFDRPKAFLPPTLPAHRPAPKVDNISVLPRVSTYQHIATIFTEDNRFDDAISICYQAIELGLEDGTQSGFSGRIARIKKKEG